MQEGARGWWNCGQGAVPEGLMPCGADRACALLLVASSSHESSGWPDYRLCLPPRTMRITRSPPSTWAAPSATKPCLR